MDLRITEQVCARVLASFDGQTFHHDEDGKVHATSPHWVEQILIEAEQGDNRTSYNNLNAFVVRCFPIIQEHVSKILEKRDMPPEMTMELLIQIFTALSLKVCQKAVDVEEA